MSRSFPTVAAVGARVRSADHALFARVARARTPRLDAVVPRLTTAADHGGLWIATAAVLALTGPSGRRAAVRGLASLSFASAVANGPAKWAFRRSRPLLTEVPALRQLAHQPTTTSFPSGHSASAVAFATGVLLEWPAVGVPVAAVAGGVAYGRVHIGVHYPSDVAVGALLGAACAVAVRRVWPTRPSRPAASAARADAPAAPDGTGLVVVVNAGAGAARTRAEEMRAEVLDALPAAQVRLVDDPDTLADQLHEAATSAAVLGVAGGDGTVCCAAAVALEAGLPLLVLPAGTLNHFAAELGITEVADALEAFKSGEAVQVTVAQAGDHLPFLNTFSLGLYPELVRQRERREQVLGKWPALAVALAEVLRHADPVRVEVDGRARLVWLLFGGNGRYHPSGFAPSWRERLDGDVVDVRLVDAEKRWSRARLVGAVLTGRLGRCRVYEERQVPRLRLRFLDEGSPELARDGESHPSPRELELRPLERRLVVYRPAHP